MNLNDIACQAYNAIRTGGLSLVYADIGYGLLGHTEDSIRKMYRLKNRPYTNPCIVAGSINTLLEMTVFQQTKLIDWIEEITQQTTLAVINSVNTKSKLLNSLSPFVRQQATLDNTVATFLRPGGYVEAMVDLADQDKFLLIGSSGNISGQGNNYSFNDIPNSILQELNFVYDCGISKHANNAKLATTIINFNNFSIRRVGVNFDLIIDSYNQFAVKHKFPQLMLKKNYKMTDGE